MRRLRPEMPLMLPLRRDREGLLSYKIIQSDFGG